MLASQNGKCEFKNRNCHEVSNALSTLVVREKPGFQALSKGLSPAVRGGRQARSSRPWGLAQRMLGGQQ